MIREKELLDGVPVTTLEQLNVYAHLDREVAVLVDENGLPWGDIIRVCLSSKSLEEQIIRFGKRAKTFTLAYVIDVAIRQNGQGIILYGFSLGDFALAKSELSKMAYAVETFLLLSQCLQQGLSNEQSYDLLKERTFYYLGSPIMTQQLNPFDFETIDKGDKAYITLFLSEETAKTDRLSHRQAVPVNLANFRTFVSGKYSLIIEPNKAYGVILD